MMRVSSRSTKRTEVTPCRLKPILNRRKQVWL
jgi:hypothetical protein